MVRRDKVMIHQSMVHVLGCFALAVLLLPEPAAAEPEQARLQRLVNAAAKQFDLAYRSDPVERQRRRAQLVVTIGAWQQAERGPENDALLEQWLRGAIQSSMPGSRASLPAMPAFDAQEPGVAPMRSGVEQAADSRAKLVGDPFLDDPSDMSTNDIVPNDPAAPQQK